jgi:hypothetical protein
MLEMLLYVSESRLEHAQALTEVDRIVATARANNRERGLSGGLIFTENHFAQVLEGESDVLDGMLRELERDPRHKNLTVVERHPIEQRQFSNWAMAYSGPSYFLDRHIRPVLAGGTDSGPALSALAREFIELRHAA